jgi:uncharacterized lipoprotein YddW (UPF0748 family)
MGRFPKATWIHHLPKDPESVRNVARRLAEADFDLVIPCVINPDGFLDYHSSVGNIRDDFKEWDPLKILVEEAHEKGIQVHPWSCVFAEGRGSKLLQDKPELAAVDKEGSPVVPGGPHRMGWACPAREEVQDYEMALYQEMMDNYPVDGVHLDYIRYGGGFMCFCDYCRETFKAESGADPVTLDAQSELWPEWVSWRVNIITKFVGRLREAARAKNVEVSAAVFAGYPECVESIGQDWVKWGKSGLVDYLFPMNYTLDAKQAVERANNHIAAVGGACPVWEGLWNKPEMTVPMLIEEIQGVLRAGAQGLVIFEYYGLSDEDIEAIQTFFSEKKV